MFRQMIINNLAEVEARGDKLADELDALTVGDDGELRSLDDSAAAQVKALRDELLKVKAEADDLRSTLAALDATAERRTAAKSAQVGNAATATGARGFAAEVRSALDVAGAEARSLATGISVAVSPVVSADVVAEPAKARRLLDMLTVNPADGGVFAYLRQTTRETNAATVVQGAMKPTSVYSLDRVAGAVDTVAHLSEPVPVSWFADAPVLEQFLTGEMSEGLLDANSAKIIAAIVADDDVAVVAYATSPLATVRRSITALEAAEVVPAALVFRAADWEVLDIAAAAAGVESVRAAGGRSLFGVPVIIDNGLAAGEGLALAADAVEVYATGGVDVQFSSAFTRTEGGEVVTGFQVNEVVCRAENRIAPAVKRPYAAVRIDLAA